MGEGGFIRWGEGGEEERQGGYCADWIIVHLIGKPGHYNDCRHHTGSHPPPGLDEDCLRVIRQIAG